MAFPEPTYTLNTGAKIPAIALGTWAGRTKEERDPKIVTPWILSGLKTGYRHLDTAWIYGTEVATGQAIRESGIPRSELFVTTKLPWHHGGKVAESIDQSLSNLGLDYVDLYLLHWPQVLKFISDDEYLPLDADGQAIAVESPTFVEVWAELEKVLASGKAKAIGVSNFSIKNLETLLKTAKVVPAVNQVELHPLLAQPELLEYTKSKGILLQAYTPSGYASVREHPTILALAKKYGTTANQITLGWHLARGHAFVAASKNAERQKENLHPATLKPEDVATVTALDKGERVCNKFNDKGKVWGWTKEQLGW
ncbi:Aldo/keto reductase [Dentipellis sp. KUC8613]|nr:Aldo/keto reductase [Dentipellis sp. KUC8613]